MVAACKGNHSAEGDYTFLNDKEARSIPAEEIVEDVMIKRLSSPIPIDEAVSMIVAGEHLFLGNSSIDRLYYFRNHEYANTLNSAGRGPGEYTNILSCGFDPEQNLLYVLSDYTRGILRYKVPEMEPIETIPSSGRASAMTVLPDGKLCVVDRSEDMAISYVTCLTPEDNSVDTLATFESVRLGTSDLCCIDGTVLMNFEWVPSSIASMSKDSYETLVQYSFGKQGIPSYLYDAALAGDLRGNMGLMSAKYSEEGKAYGGFWARKEPDAVTFWYANHSDKKGYLRFCRIYEDGLVDIIRGMKISGLNINLRPSTVTEDGYAMLITGPSDALIDPEVPMCDLARQIVEALDAQKDDNPIVMYFRMKKL